MTTIAYKDGVIATDSQLTAGTFILTQNCVKRRVHNGQSFWLSGSETDINEFVSAWPDGTIHEDSNVVGFVLDVTGTLYAAWRRIRVGARHGSKVVTHGLMARALISLSVPWMLERRQVER